MEHLQEQLDRIEQRIQNHFIFTKEILTFPEFCIFCGISKSHGYKLTSRSDVPYYKPNGKLIYFKRSELEEWMLKNPVKTDAQLEEEAVNCLSRNKGRKW